MDKAEVGPVKKCSKCGASKALSEFHRDSRSSDERRADCKLCSNATMRGWRAKPNNRQKQAAVRESAEEESKVHSARKHQRWTSQDVETLLREDITILEMSKILGRTYGSTAVARHKAKRAQLDVG